MASAVAAARVQPGAACIVPDDIRSATRASPPDNEPDPPVAGYVLALSWSPEFCRFRGSDPRHADQCGVQQFGFIVHGLWPQGNGRRHPRACRTAEPVTRATLRAHFCMMPSARLMQDQWAKHGSCGWDSAPAYFSRTQALWQTLAMPDIEALPEAGLTAGRVRDAFVAANPGLSRRALFIDRDDKGWLEEVRVCYNATFTATPCPAGIGAGDGQRLRLWRRAH